MKQVDRKFLEEQVRKSLKEQSVPGLVYKDGGFKFDHSRAPGFSGVTVTPAGKEKEEPIFPFPIEDLFFGAKYSRDQISGWSSDSLKYGFGPNRHVKKAIDEVKGISGFETFAFKFLKIAPPDRPGDMNLEFNEVLWDKLFDAIREAAKELEAAKKTDDEDEIYSVIRRFLQDKIFDEIYNEYGITDVRDEDSQGKSAWSVLIPFNFKWTGLNRKNVKTTYKPGMQFCRQRAKEVKNMRRLTFYQAQNFLNKCVCECTIVLWNGKNPTGKPILHLADLPSAIAMSNIPNVLKATVIGDYSRSINWFDLATSFADVVISTIGTISMFFTFGKGKVVQTLGLKPMIALAGKAGQRKIGQRLADNYIKVMSSGAAAIEKRAILGGGWKGGVGYFIGGMIPGAYQTVKTLENRMERLDGLHRAYFQILDTGKYSKDGLSSLGFTGVQLRDLYRAFADDEEELAVKRDKDEKKRIANAERLTPESQKKILNALLKGKSMFGVAFMADILTVWGEIYDALIDYNYLNLEAIEQADLGTRVNAVGLKTRKEQLKKIEKAYTAGDKTTTVNMINAVWSLMEDIQKRIQELEKQKEFVEASAKPLDQANARVNAIANREAGDELVQKIPQSVQKAAMEKQAGEGKSQRFGPKKSQSAPEFYDKRPEDFAKEAPTSFGSDEKTSNQIYDEIVAAFPDEITENKADNVVKVNLGFKDAIEFSKGTEGFSRENTLANIEKITNFLKSKGKEVSFTPIPVLRSSREGVDPKKFKDFAEEINTALEKSKTSNIIAPGGKSSADAPMSVPSELATDDIIIVGDSNARPLANRWYKKGKTVKGKGGYYLMDGKNIVAPTVSGGSVPEILSTTKKFFKQKGDSYKPSIAIVHMGYNGPSGAFPAYQETINYLKGKGIQDIRVIDIKVAGNTYQSAAGEKKYMTNIKNLSKKIRGLSGVTVIPNNEENNVGGDKLHFTKRAYTNLYNAAMRGATSSANIVQTTEPESIPSQATSEGVPYNLVTSRLSITRAQYDLYRVTLGQRESGQKYNIKGGAKDLYDGFYQMGAAAKIDSGIKLPAGASNWKSQVARKYFRENPAVQEEAFGKMTVKNLEYLNTSGKHTQKWQQLKKDPAKRLGILAVAHLLGHGGAKKFIRNNLKSAGSDAFGTKDIEYYNLIKNAIASGGSVSSVASNTQAADQQAAAAPAADQQAAPAPTADQQQAQQGPKPDDQESSEVVTTKQALQKFNSRLDRISKVENFEELIERFQILYGTSFSEVIGNLIQLEKYASNLDQGDLSSHRKAKFKELTRNVHTLNKKKLFSLYKKEREKNLDAANSLMAFIHRPRLITYIETNYLLYTNADGFNLSFELGPPYGNKVGVVLNEYDFFANSNFGDSKEKAMLRRILTQNKETFEALYNKLESFEIGQIETESLTEEQKDYYSRFLSSFITLFESGIDSLEDRGSSLRRSWKMDNLAAAIYLLS